MPILMENNQLGRAQRWHHQCTNQPYHCKADGVCHGATLLKQERQELFSERVSCSDRLILPVDATVFAPLRPKTVNQREKRGQLS